MLKFLLIALLALNVSCTKKTIDVSKVGEISLKRQVSTCELIGVYPAWASNHKDNNAAALLAAKKYALKHKANWIRIRSTQKNEAATLLVVENFTCPERMALAEQCNQGDITACDKWLAESRKEKFLPEIMFVTQLGCALKNKKYCSVLEAMNGAAELQEKKCAEGEGAECVNAALYHIAKDLNFQKQIDFLKKACAAKYEVGCEALKTAQAEELKSTEKKTKEFELVKSAHLAADDFLKHALTKHEAGEIKAKNSYDNAKL